MASGSEEKIYLDFGRFISQRGMERIYHGLFSKVNAIRQRKPGAWSHEEAWLNIHKAEEKSRPI